MMTSRSIAVWSLAVAAWGCAGADPSMDGGAGSASVSAPANNGTAGLGGPAGMLSNQPGGTATAGSAPPVGSAGSVAMPGSGAVTPGMPGNTAGNPPVNDSAGSAPVPGAGAGGSAAAGTTGGGVEPAEGGGSDPVIPQPSGTCPMIADGSVMVSAGGGSATVQVWTGGGTQPGPLMIYWHGTGGVAATAIGELDPTLVSDIMATGGAIISMESGGQGNPVDWGVYTLGDYDLVDQLVACSVQQLHIDTHRIYTGGASAGGLAAGTMAFARSSYLAASNPNSGGVAPWPGLATLQDKTHVPASFTMHGGDADQVVISFGQASLDMDNALAAAGGFAVDCNHGGGHVAAGPDLKAAGWEFLKAHPFGTKPSPYAAGLPAGFPSYCTIIK